MRAALILAAGMLLAAGPRDSYVPGRGMALDIASLSLPSSTPPGGIKLVSGSTGAGILESLSVTTWAAGPGPDTGTWRIEWRIDGEPVCMVHVSCLAAAAVDVEVECGDAVQGGSTAEAYLVSECTGGAVPPAAGTVVHHWVL